VKAFGPVHAANIPLYGVVLNFGPLPLCILSGAAILRFEVPRCKNRGFVDPLPPFLLE